MEDKWAEDRFEFTHRTIPRLREIGTDLGIASCGNWPISKEARKIISLYNTLYKSFDPMTHMLLKEAIDHWTKQRSKDGSTTKT